VDRKVRKSPRSRGCKGKVLARLTPDEGAGVLRSLLERHPELVAEAEGIARATVTDIDACGVAEEVEQAVLDLGVDELGTRAGRTRWGYVEPSEAAWELLGEAVDPFLGEMKRHIELGFEAAATGTCAGIVLGLYRCRDKSSDRLLGWAEDFPVEAAGHAVATLARGTRKKHRRAWRLPRAMGARMPEWADMFGRASKPPRRRRPDDGC
jgi:hypothetical protein